METNHRCGFLSLRPRELVLSLSKERELGCTQHLEPDNLVMPRKKQADERIAERIREARGKSSLSQPEVERRIGKAKNAVSRWERAQAQIDASDLGKLADLLGVSADWILGVDAAVTPEESELLRDYREAWPALRAATLAGLQAGLRMERGQSEYPPCFGSVSGVPSGTVKVIAMVIWGGFMFNNSTNDLFAIYHAAPENTTI